MWAGALWLGRGSAGHRGHATENGLAADGVQSGTDGREVNLTSSRGLRALGGLWLCVGACGRASPPVAPTADPRVGLGRFQ